MSDSKTPVYDSLLDKQKRFVDAYLRTSNALQSAREAGYKDPLKNKGTGARLLENPRIRQALEERGGDSKTSRVMGAQEALERLSSIARGSLDPFLNSEGEIDLTTEKAREALRLTGAEVTRRTFPGGAVEVAVKLLPVVDSLKALLKRYGKLLTPAEARKQRADARTAEARAIEVERKEQLLSLLARKLSPETYREVLEALSLEEGPASGEVSS